MRRNGNFPTVAIKGVLALLVGIATIVVGFVGTIVVYWGSLFWEASRNSTYFDSLRTAQPTAMYVTDFARLFPDSTVTYRFFDTNRQPGYNAIAVINDRYELTMQLLVKFSLSDSKVIGYGEPKFYLHEADNVKDRCISYDGRGQLIFGLTDWKKIVANDGDFESIGYSMKKDRPVPGLKQLIMESNPSDYRK